MRAAVAQRLPRVPFAFVADTPPSGQAAVEAVLLGSVGRDGASWEPSASPSLRFVQRFFAGVDDVPFERLGPAVEVAGNVGGMAPFVAEHAIALALACARCVPAGQAAVAAGRMRPPPELRSFWHESAVVLGYGAIGQAIAERLRPFEMRLSGLSRRGAPAPGLERSWSADQLEQAVADVGYVFDARPLTRATRGSLGAQEFGAMREDATYVNVGRGATVDEQALFAHLQGHPRFRAGIDVWWDEDFVGGALRMREPFAQLPNFVGSPHWAGFSPAVGEHALGTALDNLARFFAGERPRHVVDRSEYAP